MKSDPRGDAARKILADEYGDTDEAEPEKKRTLMDDLNETEFQENEIAEAETPEMYLKKGKYEIDLENME